MNNSELSTKSILKRPSHPLLEDSDCNNNCSPEQLQNESSNESLPKVHYSRISNSKDISEKEESLRSSSDTYKEKKSVSFFNNFPVYLNLNKGYTNQHHSSESSDSEYNDDGKDNDEEELVKRYVDASSETDLASSTESDLLELVKDVEFKSSLICKAEQKLSTILNRLQSLWLDSCGGKSEDAEKMPCKKGQQHKLADLIDRINFVSERLQIEYLDQAATLLDLDKVATLQSSNHLLKEQLKSSKMMKDCLKSEITYLMKEKALLNEEVRHLTFKMASSTSTNPRTNAHLSLTEKPSKTEVFYRNPYQNRFEQTDSNSSSVVQSNEQGGEKFYTNRLAEDDQKCFERTNNHIQKWENDFASIMHSVKERETAMDTYQFQLQTYDVEIHHLQVMIDSSNEEKHQILQELEALIEEQKALLRERDHYESILKLILMEKSNKGFDLHQLLQSLLLKLNSMSSTERKNNSSQSFLLEGALQAIQEQNSCQREEVSRLKEQILIQKGVAEEKVSELESVAQESSKQVEELRKMLEVKSKELSFSTEEEHAKCDKLQQLHMVVTAAKNALEKSIQAKEEEINELKGSLENHKKINSRQVKKIQELHKVNVKLIKEIEEMRSNTEQLTAIINQLRLSLKEQKGKFNDKLKLTSEEASQNKEHCRWLQSQIELMSQQLADAHERIKSHENDKAQLAQQVILADEERKVVDRKLQELRTALQGDTVLREALIERNEALQVEINRLRRAKLASIAGNAAAATTRHMDANPPSEMSKVDETYLTMASLVPAIEYNTNVDKGMRKNRYTSSSRRNSEAPRTAVSLHNGGMSYNPGNH